MCVCVCVYYCRTYYKAVRVGEWGRWRTCATREGEFTPSLAPATLEFWVRFPNERNQGKQAHPVFKYRVPHGSLFSDGSCPALGGLQIPLCLGSDPPMGWWLGLHQPPWSVGFDSQTRGTRENGAPPCVKVPGSSRVPLPPPPSGTAL